jgi:hypothetical protein
MKVHLIRTEDVDKELYADVVELLSGHAGPVSFHAGSPVPEYGANELRTERLTREEFFTAKEDVRFAFECMTTVRKVATWKTIFKKCNDYRRSASVPKEDYVILLTETANDPNWFSAMDPEGTLNGFVHTADWVYYSQASTVFSISYLIASLVIKTPIYKNRELFDSVVHMKPIGCISDFCANKSDIRLKLRTADICGQCMSLFTTYTPPVVIGQMISIMEAVRSRMLYHQNYRANEKPGRLLVTRHYKITLPDYSNITVKLTPLERTLYICYLRHPEGIRLTDLCDHREELISIYSMISTKGLLADIQNSISSMVDVTSNSASEKLAKIKAAFVNAIGEGLAEHYIVKGANAQPKKIHLEQGMVELESL